MHDHENESKVIVSNNVCKCLHHNFTPFLLIIFAIAVLLVEFNVITYYAFSIAWPILIIAGSAAKIGQRMCKCC